MSKKVLATVNSEKMYAEIPVKYHKEIVERHKPFNKPRIFTADEDFDFLFADPLNKELIDKEYLNIILEK